MRIDSQVLKGAIPHDDFYRTYLGEPKAGKYFCPFHDDRKTPNVVANEKGFHCFACGEMGDAFWFYCKFKNVSFVQALNELDAQYGPQSVNGNGHHNELPEQKRVFLVHKSTEEASKALVGEQKVKEKKGAGYTATGLHEYKCHESGLKFWKVRMEHTDTETNPKWIRSYSP